jgi:Tfp pilus assembly protein PilF
MVAAVAEICLLVVLGGCAANSHNGVRSSEAEQLRFRNISTAFLEGKPEAARKLLSEQLRADPRNGYLHLLNGYSYEMTDGTHKSQELALVGYEAAVKFAPGYFWSHYFSGLIDLERRDYSKAADHFSWAILDKPDRSLPFAGLAVSAYYAGDLGVARVAAERALALSPEDPLTLRIVAFVAAAGGDREYLDALFEKGKKLPGTAHDLEIHRPRLSHLLRTASTASGAGGSGGQPLQEQPSAPGATMGSDEPRQVMIEVTLLLSQAADTDSIGINLLDGLKLQFGADHLTESKKATGVPDTFSRVFTTALRVPQITYSLNLFNTRNDYYDVVVRPSLVASIGQPSEFFIGRTLTIGVSGINLGSLQPIDVGTSVKVLPLEITRKSAKFKVDTVRSFFVQDTSGTFFQSVTTFKQRVDATVEVEFGKTLILSGLFEAVNHGGSSKTPLLGSIPVVDVLFDSRSNMRGRDAALVLVTPRLPGTIDTGTREFRSETLNGVLSLWNDLVDPMANADAIVKKLGGKISKFFRPHAGDLKLPPATDPATVRQVIRETVAQLQ